MNATDAVTAALAALPEDTLAVASLGTATSALRAASGDGPHLYLGGAMGSALAAALGIASARPDRNVLAVVGDGELLMGASSLWTLAGLRPANLVVLVLDNGRYEITGGQELIAPTRFAEVARALRAADAGVAGSPAETTQSVAALGRPAIVVATVTDPAWPGPSPFVDPFLVRTRFESFAASRPGDGGS